MSPPSLARWQAEFSAALFDRAAAPPAGLLDPVCGESGFAVYRGSVMGNYAAALAAVHPVVAQLVGDEFFEHAAHAYARAVPSTSGDIHEFGAGFADFLAGLAGADHLAYLPDVARLEWLMHEAFHAADLRADVFARLAALPADAHGEVRWVLHPSVRLLRTDHPARRIWEIHQPDFDGPIEVDLEQGGEHLLVARRSGFVIEAAAIGAAEWTLLRAFRDGLGFAAALQEAFAIGPLDVEAVLVARVGDGTLADCNVP